MYTHFTGKEFAQFREAGCNIYILTQQHPFLARWATDSAGDAQKINRWASCGTLP